MPRLLFLRCLTLLASIHLAAVTAPAAEDAPKPSCGKLVANL